MIRSNKIFLAVGLILFCILVYWVIAPVKERASTELESGVTDSSEGGVLEGVVSENESEPLQPQRISFTTEEIETIETRRNEIGEKLSALAGELDSNLENEEKKKKIEAEYALLTKEYNELMIKVVKINQQDSSAKK